MKNVKTFIKNEFWTILVSVNFLLSVIELVTFFASGKINRFDNPLLKVVPISAFLWIMFAVFYKIPENNAATEKTDDLPEPKIPLIVLIPLRLIARLIFFIILLVPLFVIVLSLFLSLEVVVVPAFFPH